MICVQNKLALRVLSGITHPYGDQSKWLEVVVKTEARTVSRRVMLGFEMLLL